MNSPRLPRSKRLALSGWGRFPVQYCDVYRPERWEELQQIVACGPERSLIARGLGRAYGDAALNLDAGVILSERLDRMLDFDPETGALHCEAAVSLAEILEVFLPRGFFLPVTPGTKHITLGGAIAADVHGKNHHASGSMSAFLDSFHLLLASGEILDCSRDRNPEAFWATVGGMGLTGVILDARLRLKRVENAYVSVDYERVPNIDAVLESFLRNDGNHDYEVAWIDCLARGSSLGRGVLMRANHATWEQLPEQARRDPWRIGGLPPLTVPFDFPNAAMNSFSMRLFNAAFYHLHRNGQVIRDCNSFFYPLDSLGNWNRCYGKRGVVQYQVVIPPAHVREGIIGILEAVSSLGTPVFLAVLKPFGGPSDGLLSFPRLGHTLSLDLPYTGADLLAMLGRLDERVTRLGGAVYLAKDSCTQPELLGQMYPDLERFREIKTKLDPECRFSSSQARRLRIVEAD